MSIEWLALRKLLVEFVAVSMSQQSEPAVVVEQSVCLQVSGCTQIGCFAVLPWM